MILPTGYITQSGSTAREGSTRKLSFYVPWPYVESTCIGLVGGVQYIVGLPVYIPPAIYAPLPGLVANSAEFEKVEVDPDYFDGFSWAGLITITFGKPDLKQDDQDLPALGEVSIEVGVEAFLVNVENSGATWDSDSTALTGLDTQPVKNVPSIVVNCTVYDVPSVDVVGIANKAGFVNNSTFLGAPKNTVLFSNATTQYKVTADGNEAETVVFKLIIRGNQATWQQTFRASTGKFDDFSFAGGQKMYTTGDLSTFFS